MFTPGTERDMEDLENPREVCQLPYFRIVFSFYVMMSALRSRKM